VLEMTMKTSFLAACAALLCVSGGNAAAADANSGFLPDYSRLQTLQNGKGGEWKVWVDPNYQKGVYRQVLVEKPAFYPEPQPSAQVSSAALAEIRDYMDVNLRNVALRDVPQATGPGPGVMRVRMAITAVATSNSGLKPWQVVPAALVVQGALVATGNRKMDAELNVEGIATDSVTGEPIAMFSRKGRGFELKNAREQLTLETVKPRLDEWAAATAEFVAQRFRK
jgi:hypothetical protein